MLSNLIYMYGYQPSCQISFIYIFHPYLSYILQNLTSSSRVVKMAIFFLSACVGNVTLSSISGFLVRTFLNSPVIL